MILPEQEFWDVFKKTNGALSCCEAIAIMNLASMAPLMEVGEKKTTAGQYLEMGTHKGKSAMAAIAALPQPGLFLMLDPEFENEEWEKETHEAISEVQEMTERRLIVRALVPQYSLDFLQKNPNLMFSWVFSDAGSHQYGLPMAEVELLEDRIVPHGIIAFHDFDSQFKEVRYSYDYLLSTGKYEEVPIPWEEIKNYAREHDLEKSNLSWHHEELDFPCFVGALKRKP